MIIEPWAMSLSFGESKEKARRHISFVTSVCMSDVLAFILQRYLHEWSRALSWHLALLFSVINYKKWCRSLDDVTTVKCMYLCICTCLGSKYVYTNLFAYCNLSSCISVVVNPYFLSRPPGRKEVMSTLLLLVTYAKVLFSSSFVYVNQLIRRRSFTYQIMLKKIFYKFLYGVWISE